MSTLPPPKEQSELNPSTRMDTRIDNFSRPFESPLMTDDLGYPVAQISTQQEADLRRYNHLSYAIATLSFFTAGLLWIVPIIMSYYRRHEADGTWLETHFDWQIKTFWYGLLMAVVGSLLLFFSLGGIGIAALWQSPSTAWSSLGLGMGGFGLIVFAIFWHLYRIVRGWIALTDGRPVP